MHNADQFVRVTQATSTVYTPTYQVHYFRIFATKHMNNCQPWTAFTFSIKTFLMKGRQTIATNGHIIGKGINYLKTTAH